MNLKCNIMHAYQDIRSPYTQVYTDYAQLQENLRDGTSKECCFADHDTTTVNVVFESRGGTLSDVMDLLVRLHLCVYISFDPGILLPQRKQLRLQQSVAVCTLRLTPQWGDFLCFPFEKFAGREGVSCVLCQLLLSSRQKDHLWGIYIPYSTSFCSTISMHRRETKGTEEMHFRSRKIFK